MVVLDTHALLWWASSQHAELSRRAKKAISSAMESEGILVSSISAWEIAALTARGRISLSMDAANWLKTLMEVPGIRFVPVDNRIALGAVNLPGDFHRDPADRFIVATAREYAVPLVSKDRKILDYPHVKGIW
jgi:PIN domain nuclease of toxin-antitoxin system